MNHFKASKLVVLTTVAVLSMITQQAEATENDEQICIPAGNELITATLYLKSLWPSDNSLNISNVISESNIWDEETVTWNSFNSNFTYTYYDFIELNNSSTEYAGYSSQVIHELVENWMNGSQLNNGIMLESTMSDSALYQIYSSESDAISSRPKLVIEFSHHPSIIIERINEAGAVHDAFLDSLDPDVNIGSYELLNTLTYPEFPQKVSLVRFQTPNFCVTPGPGVGTPGYWKNHDWPEVELTFGGVSYDQDTLRRIMKHKNKKGDKSIDLLKHLAATTFNIAMGNDDSCIATNIDAANDWLSTYATSGVPGNVSAEAYAWQEGMGDTIMQQLDLYNNGLLTCAGPRD